MFADLLTSTYNAKQLVSPQPIQDAFDLDSRPLAASPGRVSLGVETIGDRLQARAARPQLGSDPGDVLLVGHGLAPLRRGRGHDPSRPGLGRQIAGGPQDSAAGLQDGQGLPDPLADPPPLEL